MVVVMGRDRTQLEAWPGPTRVHALPVAAERTLCGRPALRHGTLRAFDPDQLAACRDCLRLVPPRPTDYRPKRRSSTPTTGSTPSTAGLPGL
jgi:hypothetical protein